MRTFFCCLVVLLTTLPAPGQLTPPGLIPPRLDSLPREIEVHHFPSPVMASLDEEASDHRYFWKHLTSFLSPSEEIEVVEGGAYIFYGGKWNLRVQYPPKRLCKLFSCGSGRLKAGQPYTFADNWRTDNSLRAGWALWYVIGRTPNGRLVSGYQPLYTADEFINPNQ